MCILRGELPRNETGADQQESRNTSHYVKKPHDLFHVLLNSDYQQGTAGVMDYCPEVNGPFLLHFHSLSQGFSQFTVQQVGVGIRSYSQVVPTEAENSILSMQCSLLFDALYPEIHQHFLLRPVETL